MSQRFVQTPAAALYSGLSAAGTSMTITPYPVDLDGVKLTMTDFGATPTCTIDPKVSGYEEIVQFTGITDNGNNTATLTGLSRDLQSKYPYTGAGTGKIHGASAVVVFSDNPQVYGRLASKENNEIITGQWTFSVFPITPATPLATTAAAGFVKIATAAQVLAKTQDDGASAFLSVNPSQLASTLLSDYKVDTGAANAYAIAPVPAVTAYTVGQIFSFKAVSANTGASTLNVNALGTKTIKTSTGADVPAGGIGAGQIVVVEYDGTNFVMISNLGTGAPKFGGTGADGALAITSGVTTVSAASAAVLVKNYTSISITGTGSLAFSNPATNGTTIILKSQGNVTLTSSTAPMIDVTSMGGQGGASHASGTNYTGNAGNAGIGLAIFSTTAGTPGTAAAGGTDASTPTAIAPNTTIQSSVVGKYPLAVPGSGGGSGGSPSGTGAYTGGKGGNGAAALIIECGGAWNFTTAGGISIAGQAGGNATTESAGNTGAGGGGAGGPGVLWVLYNVLTANSGTVTTSQGSKGAGAGAGNYVGGSGISVGGSTGISFIALNTEFV